MKKAVGFFVIALVLVTAFFAGRFFVYEKSEESVFSNDEMIERFCRSKDEFCSKAARSALEEYEGVLAFIEKNGEWLIGIKLNKSFYIEDREVVMVEVIVTEDEQVEIKNLIMNIQ